MLQLTAQQRLLLAVEPADFRKGIGAPGKAWCLQWVKFPSRQGVQPPHLETSLGLMEVTT